MRPTPSWYQGRDSIGIYLRQLFASPWGSDLRLTPTGANGQPALGVYTPADHGYRQFALKVLTVGKGLLRPSPASSALSCSTGSAYRRGCR